MTARTITKNQLDALMEALDFLDAYVEYHLDDIKVIDEPTDAQRLSVVLPVLHSVFGNGNAGTYLEYDENDRELKNTVFTERKHAAECVDPNYRFCVVNSNLTECHLTDDEVSAMEFAIKKSRHCGMWNVCKIRKSDSDGTFMTHIIGFTDNGEYFEEKRSRAFLHFNYIAEAVGKVQKIK